LESLYFRLNQPQALCGVVISSGEYFFTWPSYNSAVQYDIQVSTSINGPFSGINPTPVLDTASGNFYTVTGLSSSTKYFTRLASTYRGEISFGSVVSFTTTAMMA